MLRSSVIQIVEIQNGLELTHGHHGRNFNIQDQVSVSRKDIYMFYALLESQKVDKV